MEESPKPTKIQSFCLFFYKRFSLSATIWISLVIFGVLSYTVFMQRQGFPNIEIPFSLVQVDYRVQDRERVDNEIAQKLVDIIESKDYVKNSRSISTDNNATIFIEYDQSLTSLEGSNKIEQALSETELPSGAVINFETISATKFNNKYDVLVSVTAPTLTSEELQEKAQLIAQEIRSKIRDTEAEIIPIFSTVQNPVTGQEEVVKTNFDWFGERNSQDILEINPSITIGINTKEEDIIVFNELLTKALEQINQDPAYQELSASISADFATEIKEQISSLETSLLAGLIIVILACCIFIGLKAGILAAVGMFVSLASTVGVLFALGITLNTITLFGLILALGLIVDDTIIMVEAIDAARKKGLTMIDAVKQAAKRIAMASLAGTLTTILAFAPLLFVRGILGEFIIVLPQTIIIALSVSLIVSLTFIPFASRWMSKKSEKKTLFEFFQNLETKLSLALARGVMSATTLKKKILYSLVAFIISVVVVGSSIPLFGNLKFDIFPQSKDANSMIISYAFNPNTTLEQATDITDQANTIINNEAGELIESIAYLGQSNQFSANARVRLVNFNQRDETSHQIIARLNSSLEDIEQVRISINQLDAGPPRDEFPFTVQIVAENPKLAEQAADNLASFLKDNSVTRPNGNTVAITEVQSFGEAQTIQRVNGQRIIEVKASFADDDVSALVVAAQRLTEEFIAEEENRAGLTKEDYIFDFGGETDNQESFQTVLMAMPLLILAMFILLAIQFRSILQPLLILFAVPFSLFGVALGLTISNNPLSFFVMVGLFALVGISVNNSILLTDYANQARRSGKSPREAMAFAIEKRTRPLLTTTATSIVALIPLTLSDPFWESITITLMFGLASSSIMVLIVYPYYYLVFEAFRSRFNLKKLFKKRAKA